MNETGLTTVQNPPKGIAEKRAKQVGQVTSAERGTLVTVCVAIKAIGNDVPHFLIFPRVNFKEWMTKGAPSGTVGAAHQTGWMTSDVFLQWLEHFIKPHTLHCGKSSLVYTG